MSKNRIIPQMYDVRPVDETGDLDWKKIKSVGGHMECIGDGSHSYSVKIEKEKKYKQQQIVFEQKRRQNEELKRAAIEKEERLIAQKKQLQIIAAQEELKKIAEFNYRQNQIREEAELMERKKQEQQEAQWLEDKLINDARVQAEQEAIFKKAKKQIKKEKIKQKFFGENNGDDAFSWKDIFSPPNFAFQFNANKLLLSFASVVLIIAISVGTVTYASKGIGLKSRVLGASTDGMENLNSAISDVSHQNFESGALQFDKAFANFSESSNELDSMGGVLLDAMQYVPFASKISSGKNAVEAGKHFAAAGKSLNNVAKISTDLRNPSGLLQLSLLDVFKVAETNINEAKSELDLAQQNIDKISIDDLPQENRSKFLLVKQQLPDLRIALDLFLSNSHILSDLLGANGPRKYLFLFQNNSEMRATGGFIGSYGLLDIANGHVKKFFIDGIFNPDGQLKDKIVPPLPIQKISAAWSMHDSNWFADFPMSAKKAISFYEKTGGPTADGVITFTPTIMEKLLEITGPIEMPEYDVTLDSKNFIELTQFKVEVDYDKQENKPKKILSDLAPLVLEKLLSSNDLTVVSKTAQAFLDGLSEKHILFYSENAQLQKIISNQGWSGEIISTPKDYLSVINTNVNGFKTDAVMDEHIEHLAQIQADGSIIDTVTITRKHNGGSSQYEWLNKVNADYMRVYVPLGSKLLEVSGQTREVNKEPLNYDSLGFTRDVDVEKEEDNTTIDSKSGTRIFEESNKTVFANWTYTSPQEIMVIKYKYLLPFSLFKVSIGEKEQVDSYSLVAQKQSGSFGSGFISNIEFPADYNVKWNFPAESSAADMKLKTTTKLDKDRFFAAVFGKK